MNDQKPNTIALIHLRYICKIAMNQQRLGLKFFIPSLIGLMSIPSAVHSYSLGFKENPEAFKEYLNREHSRIDDSEYEFMKLRKCIKTINPQNTIYQCKDSTYRHYSIRANPNESGRYNCNNGGFIRFTKYDPSGPNTLDWKLLVKNKNCNGSFSRPFLPNPDKFMSYLNRKKIWNGEPKIIFRALSDCRFSNNGKLFACYSGNAIYNNWKGTERCEIKNVTYNEQTLRYSLRRGWCREANLWEQLEIIRWNITEFLQDLSR